MFSAVFELLLLLISAMNRDILSYFNRRHRFVEDKRACKPCSKQPSWKKLHSFAWSFTSADIFVLPVPLSLKWLLKYKAWGIVQFPARSIRARVVGYRTFWGHKLIHSRQSDIEEPPRCNNNNLLIYKISWTCFGQSFAHLQERKTEIFTAYGIMLLW